MIGYCTHCHGAYTTVEELDRHYRECAERPRARPDRWLAIAVAATVTLVCAVSRWGWPFLGYLALSLILVVGMALVAWAEFKSAMADADDGDLW